MWPLDWPILKRKTVRRDDGDCVRCSEPVEYVAYQRWPPRYGWGTSNLISLCERCAPPKVQFDEARVAAESDGSL
jgi:hypothetical protein